MTIPLTSPQPAPTRSAVTTMTIQWKSSAIAWVASVVAHTEDRATIAPTDRSMPPPMITNVIPMLTTPMTAASRRMVSTLSTSRSRSCRVSLSCSAVRRSLHHEVEHPVLVEPIGRSGGHDGPVRDDQHPVGEAEDLRDL